MSDEMPEKEPFVGEADRPLMRYDGDTPISQLRVRDIAEIIGIVLKKEAGADESHGADKRRPVSGNVPNPLGDKWYDKQSKEKEDGKPEPREKAGDFNFYINVPQDKWRNTRLDMTETKQPDGSKGSPGEMGFDVDPVERQPHDVANTFTARHAPSIDALIQQIADMQQQIAAMAAEIERLKQQGSE